MCYLAQPCDEFSDAGHTAKIHGTLAKADQGTQEAFRKLRLSIRIRVGCENGDWSTDSCCKQALRTPASECNLDVMPTVRCEWICSLRCILQMLNTVIRCVVLQINSFRFRPALWTFPKNWHSIPPTRWP